MAEDKTTHSHGTRLKKGTWAAATPETIPTMTDFGQAMSIDIPELKTTFVSASRLYQSDRYNRFRNGRVDPGEITIDGHFDKTDYDTLKTLVDAGTQIWLQVNIPEPDDATHLSPWSAHGWISSLGIGVPDDEGVSCAFAFKVNGKPQFTAYA